VIYVLGKGIRGEEKVCGDVVTAHKCLSQLVFVMGKDEKGIDIVTQLEFKKVMATTQTRMKQMA
jgi:hypothetical protein